MKPAEAILEAWRSRFPNNVYAWPGAPESFAAEAARVVAQWCPIETAPKDTWILICDDNCWPPDLVRWQPHRKERWVNGNFHFAVSEGWFGSPGGRSRFDVPKGHLMKATRWHELP